MATRSMLAVVLLSAMLVRWGAVKGETCDEPRYEGLDPTHTMCLPVDPTSVVVTLTQEMKDSIVDRHNELRANVNPAAKNMEKMVWDEKLAKVATKWAQHCKTGHDDNREEPDYPNVFINQNAAQGHASFVIAIDKWYDEVSTYTWGGGYVTGAGHFYQVVWARASRVGCGEVQCPDTAYKVFRACNYAIGIDTSLGDPYLNGTSCEDCPEHCSNNLCDCGGKLCYNGGYTDVATCQCQCPRGWRGEFCEKRDCTREPWDWCSWESASSCGPTGSSYLKTQPELCHILCGICPAPIPENGNCADRKDGGCEYASPLCLKPSASDPDSVCVCTKEANKGSKVVCQPDTPTTTADPVVTSTVHRQTSGSDLTDFTTQHPLTTGSGGGGGGGGGGVPLEPIVEGGKCGERTGDCESAAPMCMKPTSTDADSACVCTQITNRGDKVECSNGMPTAPLVPLQFLLVCVLCALAHSYPLP